MDLNNKHSSNDEINLSELIRSLWKDKIIIIFFCLIFFFSAYFYSSTKPKEFKTNIVLREIPETLFIKFDKSLPLQQNASQIIRNSPNYLNFTANDKKGYAAVFEDEFNQYLNSFDNINDFVEQNNKIDSFKEVLKKRKVSAKNYFLNGSSKNKFGHEKDKNNIIKNNYYLYFPKELIGDEFLNNYVLFAFKNSENTFKKKLVALISNEIDVFEKALLISKELNIENPILQHKLDDSASVIINEPTKLYFSGIKVISSEIEFYKKLLTDAQNLKIEFNPILDKASKPVVTSKSPKIFGILGLIAGLLFSFIFIIVRNVLKNK